MTASLRIVVIGNQGTYGYRLARWLRDLEIETDLITIEGKDQYERDRIDSLERGLADVPAWTLTYRRYDARFGTLAEKYDVGLTVGPSGLRVVTQTKGLPIAHFAMGSDVHESPMSYRPPNGQVARLCHAMKYRLFSSRKTRNARATALDYRKALHEVRVLIAVHPVITRAAHSLGLADKLRAWPFPEDVERNRSRIDLDLLANLNTCYARFDRVILWLSRLNFLNPSSPNYKGVDHFLTALHRLVHEDGENVLAVIGRHGTDVEEFQRRVGLLGIADNVEYVPHLPHWKLLTYLSIHNAIVCDAMGPIQNVPSGLTREAASVGAALVTNLDNRSVEWTYGTPCPVEIAADAETCYGGLRRLTRMNATQFAERRRDVSNWARNHLDYRILLPKLIAILQEIAYLDVCERCS